MTGTQDTCSLVQVYQWYETEDSHNHNTQTGDHDNHVEKSYSYDTDWFDHHIDSSNFANTLGTQSVVRGVPTHDYLQATTTLTWTHGQSTPAYRQTPGSR